MTRMAGGWHPQPGGPAGAAAALGKADADPDAVAAVGGTGAGMDSGDCDGSVSGNGPALRGCVTKLNQADVSLFSMRWTIAI